MNFFTVIKDSLNIFCKDSIVCTLSAIRSFPRFCEQFSESSTVGFVYSHKGKEGELSDNYLQNLENDLMADSVHLCHKYLR